MRKIYAIGETVYDIIFRKDEIITGRPGGSMLNSCISLGRIGLNVFFISEIGDDNLGRLIENYLNKNGVKTNYLSKFNEAQTSLALAFLDKNQDAHYSFYKSYPKKRLQQDFPDVNKNDVVLFGSFYSLIPEVRKAVITFVKKAKEKGAIILYDPNIRSPHKKEIPALKKYIYENFAYSDIIRASNEDFRVMFGLNEAGEVFDLISEYSNANLIYTSGPCNVHLFTNKFFSEYSVNPIKPVSTIGAGDNFNAGIIFSIIKNNIQKSDLTDIPEKTWKILINNGISFSSEVCLSFDNYISKNFTENRKY